ncbi:MAG: hypothetical protein ABGZ17_31300 [Planctomycetaceae bacterium]
MMSNLIHRIPHWIDRVADVANPILVKETRQALKGRQFAVTFILLLTASWIISAAYAINSPEAVEYGAVAMELFFAFYVVLSFAVVVIVPLGAFLSLTSENQENTLDLLSITTLNSGQIVRGKLASTTVQMLVYYSAIAPFMAFTALLNGFDYVCCFFLLGITMLASVSGSILALMMAAVLQNKRLQSLLGMLWLLIVLGFLLSLYGWFLALAGLLINQPLMLYGSEFWANCGALCVATLSYVFLIQQITASQLTFESDNRTSGIRCTATIQIVLYIVIGSALTMYFLPTSIDASDAFALSIPIQLHVVGIGFFQVTQPDALSRRVMRKLPANRLRRLLWIPFLPGGNRGLLWVVLNLTALPIALLALSTVYAFDWSRIIHAVCASLAYIVIFLGFSAFLTRWLLSRFSRSRPLHARVICTILITSCLILPYIPLLLGLGYSFRAYNPLEIINPFATVAILIDERTTYDFLVLPLIAIALLALAINGRPIYADFRRIMDVVPRQPTPDRTPTVVQPSDVAPQPHVSQAEDPS